MRKSMKNVSFFLKSILISTLLTGCVSMEEPHTDFFVMDGGSYPMQIEVIINPDVEIAAEYVKDNLDSTITACEFDGAAGLTFDFQDGKPGIIWLSDINDPGIINHELLHATVNLMRYSGVSFDDSSEEAYAYQLQYLTNQFYNKIK